MTKFEDKYVYTYPLQPLLWKRYIDDIFLIWPCDENSLTEFIEHLNTVHPTIKVTSDISDTKISFLDLTIYIKQSALHTMLYTKPTDRHMYLNYLSEHPMSLKKSTIFTILEIEEIHSEIQHLLESCIHLYLYFRWREYPHDVILQAWTGHKQVHKRTTVTKLMTAQLKMCHSCLSLHTIELTPISKN